MTKTLKSILETYIEAVHKDRSKTTTVNISVANKTYAITVSADVSGYGNELDVENITLVKIMDGTKDVTNDEELFQDISERIEKGADERRIHNKFADEYGDDMRQRKADAKRDEFR